MKLNVGDVLEIEGKIATVCYTTVHNNTDYICVAFEEEEVNFDFFKYKYEDRKLLVAKVKDEVELFPVLKTFVNEGLSQYGLPEELDKLYSKLAEQMDNK